jgi:hypothetical protein
MALSRGLDGWGWGAICAGQPWRQWLLIAWESGEDEVKGMKNKAEHGWRF